MKKFFPVLFLIGCAEPTVIIDPTSFDKPLHWTVVSSSKEDNNWKSALVDSLNEWQSRTNYMVQYDFFLVDDVEDKIPTKENTIVVLNHDVPEGRADGKCFRKESSSKIYIESSSLNDHGMRAVMMHELGHAMKLKHSDDDDSIMSGDGVKVNKVQNTDIIQFCEVWNCRIKFQ